jgi:hypothetical protein
MQDEHAEHNQAYSGDPDLPARVDDSFRPSTREVELIK